MKILARQAGATSISLGPEFLVLRAGPGGLYDRLSLYRDYGVEARISTNVLRIRRALLPTPWMPAIEKILSDMIRLKTETATREPVTA